MIIDTRNAMNNTNKTSLLSRQQGISLFELLMCVAIIGIMCSMALPMFGAQQDVFAAMKDKRNAQELVSECAVAKAAGINFVVPGNLDATLTNLQAGAKANSGAFKGREFGMKGLSAEEVALSKAYLKLQNGDLVLK